ncbi:hypothetical protein [Schleiferilactobacillus perolens]|uniref:Uncharacterized protein n=1 Tax=Schleiferilactobacillus perolens DSM 12744 TaxID=1423792 RepID=A0A0R1MFS5_9LACO|nr:hypothetical protein [Schleiferilactobacillus perolens]KRL06989.1 hypothetical protein FD09_GL002063 [Schleiferilactobacillus perolens DSM 12744]
MADTTSTTPQDGTFKQVFMTYQSQQKDGNFYTVYYVPQDAVVDYPVVADPIPDEIKDKVVKYNGVLGKWEDSGVDPNTAEIIALKAQNAALTKQLAMSSATLVATQKTVAQANQAIAALTKQLAAVSKPETTTNTTKEGN